MAFCMKCGMQIPENVKFCPNCGTPVAQEQQPINQQPLNQQPVYAANQQPLASQPITTPTAAAAVAPIVPAPAAPEPPKKKGKGKIFAIIGILLLLAAIGGAAGWYLLSDHDDDDDDKDRHTRKERTKESEEEIEESESNSLWVVENSEEDIDSSMEQSNETTEESSEEVVPKTSEEPEVILPENDDDPSVTTINVWSFNDEVPQIFEDYKKSHPDFKYNFKMTVINNSDGNYVNALDTALAYGGYDAPDIYCVDTSYALRYTQLSGSADYAATYRELGIDIDRMLKDAEIAQYSIEIGTRPSDHEVVALGYQSTGGAFIYRRSIAKAVWGTDEPAAIKEIIGGGSGNWNKFWIAAEDLKAKGYGIVSGDGDIWHAVENSADQGWVVDGFLTIDPKREAFLDISKKLYDCGYSNGTIDWTEDWYLDMTDERNCQILGFFGPAWFVNYVLKPNCGNTYGDWAVCESPIGFSWGGTYLIANKDSKVKHALGEVLQWVTLEYDENSLQYQWANGTLGAFMDAPKDTVASAKVMARANGKLDFLDGQNIFDIYIPASKFARGDNMSPYDDMINQIWRDQVRRYAFGEITREDAIYSFKYRVAELFPMLKVSY